jgi:hypothetical protein
VALLKPLQLKLLKPLLPKLNPLLQQNLPRQQLQPNQQQSQQRRNKQDFVVMQSPSCVH